MNFTVDDAISWLDRANEKYQTNKQYLTKLDQTIGDGDHGINMARGFQKVADMLHDKTFDSVANVVKSAAMTVMAEVGGAAGPLYGTAFLKMSLVFKDQHVIDEAVFTDGLEEALNGLKMRGKVSAGEKTLVDVWEPVVTQLQQANTIQADSLLHAAKNALEKTKTLQATKGRAAYFKEKSVGHIDAGAASSYYLFEALAEIWDGGE